MSVTLLDILTNTLVDIGVVPAGATAGTPEITIALSHFRRLLSQMNAQGIFAWYTQTQTFTLASSASSYSIGPTASTPDLVMTSQDTRPPRIDRAKLILTDANPDVEVELYVINTQQFEGITIPALETVLPSRLYYSPTWPNGTLRLWPIPTDLSNTLKLWWRHVIDIYTSSDYTTDLSLIFPDGWEDALTMTLGEKLAAGPLPRQLSEDYKRQAKAARLAVIPNNEPPMLATDSPDKGRPAGYSLSRFYSRDY